MDRTPGGVLTSKGDALAAKIFEIHHPQLQRFESAKIEQQRYQREVQME